MGRLAPVDVVYKFNSSQHEDKIIFLVSCVMVCLSSYAQDAYKFQNMKLPDEKRIDLLLKELTLDEKITLLGSDLAVPRLGILPCRHHEGLHGLALGGPAAWGGREKGENGRMIPKDCPTTISLNLMDSVLLGTLIW